MFETFIAKLYMLFILKSDNNIEAYKVKTESSLQLWFIPLAIESQVNSVLFIVPI